MRLSATATAAKNRTGQTGQARRWWILAIAATAQLMVVLDGTVVNVALPTAQADLGFSDASRQWVVTVYSLAFGSLLLICGRLGDRFGQRRAFVVGLIGFGAASAAGGWAPDLAVLLAARAVQGAFGALLAPAALSILTVTFSDAKDRAKAFGIYGAVASSGGAVGLLLGGVLTSYLSWRWCLYVNVVFAAAAVVAALVFLPRTARTAAYGRTDWLGTVLVIGGLFAVVLGFGQSETQGWAGVGTLVPLGVGVLLLLAFVAVELRTLDPLLPMRILLDRVRGTSYLVMLLAAVGLYAIYLFLAYYLQRTLGYPAILAGIAFLPMAICTSLTSTLSSSLLIPRFGLRMQTPLAAAVATAGLIYLSTISTHANYLGGVLPGLIAAGVGLGALISAATASATLGVQPDKAGVASAVLNTSQQVGGAIGIAALSSISLAASTSYTATNSVADAAANAPVAGYHAAFLAAAVALAAAGIIGLRYPKRRR
ncbi:MAG TPA: MFS transporter [Pseudonocardiaceae bacterium]|nr:MFS transporter [Pseudonocardiaceae bacterium]